MNTSSARASALTTIVRKIVLENDDPFVPLLIERKAAETQLFVKQVKVEGVRSTWLIERHGFVSG